MTDYLRYYDLERYLFEDIRERFHAEHSIGAFDFFSIIIWKANRSKSRIAAKLLRKNPAHSGNLEAITQRLTSSLYEAPDHRERMRILIEDWEFGLPIASALLTVFWPGDFSVYDYRVREALGYDRPISTSGSFEKTWDEYLQFITRLRNLPLSDLSLRDRDRYLWAKSAAEQLDEDLRRWESSQ